MNYAIFIHESNLNKQYLIIGEYTANFENFKLFIDKILKNYNIKYNLSKVPRWVIDADTYYEYEYECEYKK